GGGAGRAPAPPRPAPARRPQPESMVGGTTASGLPRRVSHSLKNPQGQAPAAEPTPTEDRAAGHEKLLADLGAFTDGERAAREKQGTDESGEQQQ
ncbi:ATP-binding protein, partial [Amycolatopsis sp. NPDC006125]